MDTNTDTIVETIISLERQALDTWNKGDVEGQLRFYADDVTFFDPITAARLDGRAAVAEYFRALWAGKVHIPRYEMINPRVDASPELSVLSYNLVNYFHRPDGSEAVGTCWNSTQVYRQTDAHWRVVHVHWSFTKHPAFANLEIQG